MIFLMFRKNTALLAFTLLLAGCGKQENISQLINCEILRVVAMAPNTAEILYALGLSNEVVGVSRFTTYPPEAMDKPIVGGLYDPNWEMIVTLQPDLVVGLKTQKEIEGQLNALSIDFLGVSHERIDDILQSILIIGKACGAETEAQELFQSLELTASGLAVSSNDWKPKVLVCVGHDETLSQLYIAARGTFYDELIERAGGVNACEIMAGNYPEISPEGLAAMRPDVVIDIFPLRQGSGQANPKKIENRNSVASKHWKTYCERVTLISDDYASIPGPRFVLLLKDFIDAIQERRPSE